MEFRDTLKDIIPKSVWTPLALAYSWVFRSRQAFFLRLEEIAQRNLGKGWWQPLEGEVAALLSVAPTALDVVIDVGAHKGDFAHELLKARSPQRLVLVEPSTQNAATLRERFSGKQNVEVVQRAVSAKSEEATLYADDPTSALGGLIQRDLRHVQLTHPKSETVRTIRLDELCADLAIDRISILKIDIEGLELVALQSAGNLLKATDLIQLEFGGANIDSKTYFRDIWYALSGTHRLMRVTPHGPMEITAYSEREECFNYSNLICVRRTLL